MIEIRTCQNCKQSFEVVSEDFEFYSKINVPAPTWCPECRMRRRMMFRNERTLYKGTCKLCRKDMISMYPKDTEYTVYCYECWNSDKWDPLSFGENPDFTKPFFQQFGEFLKVVPRGSVEGSENLNCPYTNYTWHSKNVYMSSSILYSDNAGYIKGGEKCIDSFDCFQVTDINTCYECVNCERCNNCKFLVNSHDCLDSAFLFDCANCSHCIMSTNLRNEAYVIENKKYSENEFREKLKELKLDTFEGQEFARKQFADIVKNAIHKYARITKAVNATGDNLLNVKDVKYCFDLHNIENCRYVVRGWNVKDSMDLYGTDDTQWDYESVNNGLFSSHLIFTTNCHTNCLDIQYSDYCRSSSYLFACISVKNKKHCILNKQYSEEEYAPLKNKIIEHMRILPYTDKNSRTYTYGEFFPPEISPFAYNEVVAQEYFPVTEETAVKEGFGWKQPEEKQFQITMERDMIPQSITGIADSILKEVIACAHKRVCNDQCSLAFRLTPAELEFYKRTNTPLPHLCPNCRHYERLKFRNPLKLWHRSCMCEKMSHGHASRCPNEFETSYASEKPEKVYCESCYQQEVV